MAGKAALVPAGDDPRAGAHNAGLAGASDAVLYGTSLPSGALGLDENINRARGQRPRSRRQRGERQAEQGEKIDVSIGKPFTVSNPDIGKIAPFSSQGPLLQR